MNTEQNPDSRNSMIAGVLGLVLSLVAALWSVIGGACCGWGGWPLAFLGLIAAGISLYIKKNAIGWIALGLAIFAFAWVIFGTVFLAMMATKMATGGSN